MIVLKAQRGRVALTLTGLRLGRDLCVTLAGGDREHIGAVAVCGGGGSEEASVITLPGHREDQLARAIAARVAQVLDAVVCVACGIHLEHILPEELSAVLELSEELTGTLIERLVEVDSET